MACIERPLRKEEDCSKEIKDEQPDRFDQSQKWGKLRHRKKTHTSKAELLMILMKLYVFSANTNIGLCVVVG